jgi:type III secretion protein F
MEEKKMSVNNLNFDYINTTVATAVQNAETSLKAKVASLDTANTSATDLLMLQQEVSKWTIMTQIQSTLVKEVSDAMKGIIQKAG